MARLPVEEPALGRLFGAELNFSDQRHRSGNSKDSQRRHPDRRGFVGSGPVAQIGHAPALELL